MTIRRHPSISTLLGMALVASMQAVDAGVIQGTALDSQRNPLANAAVWVMDTAAWPKIRTLTDAQGRFRIETPEIAGVRREIPRATRGLTLSRPGKIEFDIRGLDGKLRASRTLQAPAGTWRLSDPTALLRGLPHGTWLVSARSEGSLWTETVVGPGRGRGEPRLVPAGAAGTSGRSLVGGASPQLLVRKAGYEPLSIDLPTSDSILEVELQTGRFERSIDSVMALMDTLDKFGQMAQGIVGAPIGPSRLGSVLSGGGEAVADYEKLQAQARTTARKIPILYGIDAVHGHAKWEGATVLPHNIGLGATRDTSLLRRLGEVTAKEMWAGNADWAFAPCIAVARDERWGRTYESYGETPELAARLGSSYVKGLQGDGTTTPWRVVACAKHYLADGGTTWGTGTTLMLNEGDSRITQAELDSIHLPGYIGSVASGVNTVMASYSSFNGKKMHANRALLTDTLKTDLAFDGFVVSDWEAIKRMATGTFQEEVGDAVNAGMDMAMEPGAYGTFILDLQDLVRKGTVPMSRVDDAVRRILRVKFRQGLFASSARRTAWDAEIGRTAHREVAREAVRKSLVVLKNGDGTLPLPKTGRTIAVVGSHADNTGLQCGGWTKVGGNDGTAWNGAAGKVAGATSILAGMQSVAAASVKTSATGADVVVVVAGETPYAETTGDTKDLAFPAAALQILADAKKAGQKTVLVVVSGRPLVLGDAVANADAIVAAWLPGSEGAGVADVLFGDYAPSGKLPCSWPAMMGQIPINVGGSGYNPLYAYGHGLTW